MHLGDAGIDRNLRVDSVARFIQDVANDDWLDVGFVSDLTYVVRRTSMRLVDGACWPTFGQHLTLTTWCSGTGPAWAERRTDLAVDGRLVIETAGLWVPIDQTGQPRRLPAAFYEIYAEAAGGRRISGRVISPDLSPTARSSGWALRRADIDVVGHVNNAAVWCAVSEVATPSLRWASLVHHGSLEGDDEVSLSVDGGRFWLVVDGAVRVSGEFDAGEGSRPARREDTPE